MIQKFSEAAPQMKVGDKFRVTAESFDAHDDFELWEDDPGEYYFKTKSFKKLSLSPIHFNLEGEIIRAEPEVLTAYDVVKLFRKKYGLSSATPSVFAVMDNHLIDLSQESLLNGQLKEWKRLKPYIENLLNESMNAIFEARSLTPPWECEK